MKPAPFDLHTPRSLAAALELKARFAGEAKFLAGGQSLVPAMNMRLSTPAHLIDLNRVEGLAHLRLDDGTLRIGAMARHQALERSPILAGTLPVLAEAAHTIGHAAIRSRGTVGGSLAHADPAATLAVPLMLLGASVVLVGADEERRRLPLADFLLGPFLTAIDDDEILAEVIVPLPEPGTGFAFRHVHRRAGDFPLVSAAVSVRLAQGRLASARAYVGAATDVPRPLAFGPLVGRTPAEAERLLPEFLGPAIAELPVVADLHASADLRRHLLRHALADAFVSALAAAGDPEGSRRGASEAPAT